MIYMELTLACPNNVAWAWIYHAVLYTFHNPFLITEWLNCHGTCPVVSMPLGSIAEWRVRIGSSWCALGRPFKARSPFRGGGGQLQVPLTLNQVVTMMMVLITFTTLNLVLCVVWTTGHYDAYLGEYIWYLHGKIPSIMNTIESGC